MKTLDEQYKIQYDEIKQYWKKKRHKRAVIYLILTIIVVIALGIFSQLKYFELTKYPLIIGILAGITCILRELIMPLEQEIKDIKHLEEIYDEERFKERKG